jgi:hypothetical protein
VILTTEFRGDEIDAGPFFIASVPVGIGGEKGDRKNGFVPGNGGKREV